MDYGVADFEQMEAELKSRPVRPKTGWIFIVNDVVPAAAI